MPGIFGLITRMPRAAAEAELCRMVEAIRHEPFYQTGTWIDESLGVYVGWTALKGSFSDRMPIRSEGGDVCMVFSGEEYSEGRAAHQLRTSGDSVGSIESGYLVRQYQQDPNFIQNL